MTKSIDQRWADIRAAKLVERGLRGVLYHARGQDQKPMCGEEVIEPFDRCTAVRMMIDCRSCLQLINFENPPREKA